MMFKYIKYEPFINLLFTILFLEKMPKKLISMIIDYPNSPKIYNYEYSKNQNENKKFSDCI